MCLLPTLRRFLKNHPLSEAFPRTELQEGRLQVPTPNPVVPRPTKAP
jgi:hypothetical protein